MYHIGIGNKIFEKARAEFDLAKVEILKGEIGIARLLTECSAFVGRFNLVHNYANRDKAASKRNEPCPASFI